MGRIERMRRAPGLHLDARMKQTGKCYVYVLHSLSSPDRHYVGLTDDILRHLEAHNRGALPQTARHRPWRLHVMMKFGTPEGAAQFEKFLKSASGREFTRTYFQ
jgi:putative endonuclease